MVRPNASTNGNGHLAVIGDSTARIPSLRIQALNPTARGPVVSRQSYRQAVRHTAGSAQESLGQIDGRCDHAARATSKSAIATENSATETQRHRERSTQNTRKDDA